MKRPTILLVDDHSLVLAGFHKLLETEFDILGTAEDGRALLDMAPKLKPDVVLLDISMPRMNGIEAGRQLKKSMPEVRLIFLSMHADPMYVTEAFRAGASGYVLKRSAASELLLAIQQVLKGRSYVTPLVTKTVLNTFLSLSPKHRSKSFASDLTPRQREVLQLVAEGNSTKKIADFLNISVKTVEFHKSQIMQELDIHTVAELTRFAIAQGLVSI
ncbi:MAG: DNA-binding response regulator [Nitrospirae bacterium 13_2_20CM_2_61_4]|nr:MAG: DNA-binding response regulator [Nitrospirae bacterium 13_2_20CM_2_61_4]